MRTIFLGHAVSSTLMTLVVLWIWIQNRRRFQGTTLWLLSFMFQTIGIILILMRDIVPDYASVILSNMSVLVGAVFFLFGLIRFTEVKFSKIQNYILLAISFILFSYLLLVKPWLQARIVIFSFSIIFITVQGSWLLLKKVKWDTRKIYRGTGLVLLMYIVLYIVRIVINILYPQTSTLFSNLIIDTILNIIIQMLSIALTFSLVMMINGRLFYELNKYSEEREKMMEELRRLATTDNLTGVYNRMKLEQLLTAEVLRSRRYNRPLSVILIDVDLFKLVNDTFGHNVGDTVLKTIARILKENIRESDFIGRWGGEEFLIINPETEPEGSRAVAEKLREAVGDYCFEKVGQKTISLGIAGLQENEWEENMLQRADKALYRAKHNGRNRVEM